MREGKRRDAHLADKDLLGLRAEVAMDGGLNFIEVLDHILEVVCRFVSEAHDVLQCGHGHTLYLLLDHWRHCGMVEELHRIRSARKARTTVVQARQALKVF